MSHVDDTVPAQGMAGESSSAPSTAQADTPESMYLELLMGCLTRSIFGEKYRPVTAPRGSLRWALYWPVRRLLGTARLEIVRRYDLDPGVRASGHDWPVDAETMVGLRRLENLQSCITDVLNRQVPGDLIETGVWRGGACIFMRAVLKVHGDTTRTVWAADSFRGLPKPNVQANPVDAGDRLWSYQNLAVPVAEVRSNFARYGLLDGQVRFLEGWFSETLRSAPIESLAVLRLDGDMYGSTMDALTALYPKLSVGGYVIVDDYYAMPSCRQAVSDYRSAHGITDEIIDIDWTGVYWRRDG